MLRVVRSSGFNQSRRDYFAALLRTRQSFVAPTQGKLLNYVERVPLGVVAQITVCILSAPSLYIYKQHSQLKDSLSTTHYL
jgi:hypothetical protein